MSETNYLICIHNDLDGFCCGAIILRHYPDAHVFFATSNTLFKTLYRIKHSLVENLKNLLFICDISLNKNHVNKINQALRYIRKDFQFEFIWIDHHEWPVEGQNLRNYEKIWNPTQKSAAILVQNYTDPNSNFEFVNMAEGIASFVDYHYWKTVIRNVCKTSFSDGKLEPVLRAFSRLERTPESDEFHFVIKKLSVEDIGRMESYMTNEGRKFAVLDLRKISYKINLYKEVFRLSHHYNCDLICVIFKNEEISCYKTNRLPDELLSLSFLGDYGAVGHLEKGAVHIPTPFAKTDVFGFQRPLNIEEFIDVLKKEL